MIMPSSCHTALNVLAKFLALAKTQMFMLNSYHVHVKSKKYFAMSKNKKFMPSKGSCHIHAITRQFMKMVKSMNFIHDMAALHVGIHTLRNKME